MVCLRHFYVTLLCVAAPWSPLLAQPSPPTAKQKTALLQRVEQVREQLTQQGRKLQPALLQLSLAHEANRLRWLLRWRRLGCDPTPEVARLERDLSAALARGAPHHQPGVHRLAYRSHLDGRSHPFVVVVPRGYSPRKASPLIVMLHGMGSGPMCAVGRLLGISDDQLARKQLPCRRPRLPARRLRSIIVAPNGFGDARFRGPGEVDVRAVLRRVKKLYRVDPRRVTITGLSMGGTGAAEIALQHPHSYAGVMALCGYYDRRLDSSTRGMSLLPWELRRMKVYSATDWAVNGQYLPLLLIHGKSDGPRRAEAMRRSYQRLGHPVTSEIHDVGHDVWTPGYKDGRALKLLGKLRQGRAPRTVTFTTGRARIRRSYWVNIERLADHRRWAVVKASIEDRRKVRVRTTNVAHLVLHLPLAHVSRRASIELQVDSAGLVLPAVRRARWSRRVELWRKGSAGAWALGSAPPAAGLRKGPGLSGPLDDIYYEPIVVVHGTGGGQARLLRSVALRLRRPYRRVSLRYPVVSDRRYRRSRYKDHALILVGNQQTNRVLARLAPRLPIQVDSAAVRVGAATHRRPHVGAIFIYPNPESPGRYIKVVAGTTERSYELLPRLPGYLPDYVVFDENIDNKPFGPIVGDHRKLVDGGTFDEQWRLRAPASQPASRPSGHR